MSFFRELKFEVKYFFEELFILMKHPSRKMSRIEVKLHWWKIWNILIFHPWYCIKRGVRNLYIWFPLIWKNDVWDYIFLINMMDMQMKEMQDFFLSDKPVVLKAKHVGKRIAWTRKLMDMWREEHYTMLEYEKHKAKFPNEPSMFDHDEEDITKDEYGIPVLYRCKPQSLECSFDFKEHSKRGRKMDAKCKALWLKNLNKIDQWWD